MLDTTPAQNSLVLYKNRPASVKRTGEKLEILLQEGKTVKVRPKDVALLHPGPIHNLDELRPPAGEVTMAWELLEGETTTLAELAELVYGEYTPATAWAAWEVVAEGIYFRGTPTKVAPYTPAEVAQELATRAAKAAEEQAWAEFLARARAGQVIPEDARYLREAEALALGQQSKCRLLRELGRGESQENAHAFLLEVGHWDQTVVPYLHRLKIVAEIPTAELPPLPDDARLDLTHLPAFAIDDEGSQDPDDALSLEDGRLWVHVADAAALVDPDSPADLAARARGATLYLPDGKLPMLPFEATRRLALGLAEISPALSFGLDLTPGGEIEHVEVALSWVRVTRLSYAEVERRLDETSFSHFYHLAQTYEARRRANGAIEIDLPEVKVEVGADGGVTLRPIPPLRSRNLVREAMLMAGEGIARFALEREIPFAFATQEADEAEEPPKGLADMFALRRTLKRSQMKSAPARHAGLGMELYTQATSPLRRYLDLVVHQQLRRYLHQQELLGTQEILERVGAADAIAGTMRQVERLVNKHWTMVYLRQNPGWRGQGILVEKRGTRGIVLMPELGLESRVQLRDDLPLDTTLSLLLSEVNLVELEAYFQVEN